MPLLILLLLTLLAPQALASDPSERQQGSRFGFAVLALPDLNGDGVGDVAVGAPGHALLGRAGAGLVFILDGASGDVIGHWMPMHHDGLGHSLERLPDLDGDGLEDVLVGFERLPFSEVRSSATGRVLGTLPYSPGFVHTINDVNGDGRPELLVAQSEGWRVLSGRLSSDPESEPRGSASKELFGSFHVIQTLDAPAKGTFHSVDGLGDSFGDGITGIITGKEITFLRTVSDGSLRYRTEQAAWGTNMEGRISNVLPSRDGLLVATTAAGDKGHVYLMDRDGEALSVRAELEYPFLPSYSGLSPLAHRLSVPGDLDADGRDDVLVATPDKSHSASVAAFSSVDGSLLWKASWGDSGGPWCIELETLGGVGATRDVLAGTSYGYWYVRHDLEGSVRLLSGESGETLWQITEAHPKLADPFELTTLNKQSVLVITGSDSRVAEQVALLREDQATLLDHQVLVLVLDGSEVHTPFAELSFELSARYLRERFEVSALDFEMTLVGLDGEAKEYYYSVTPPTKIWGPID